MAILDQNNRKIISLLTLGLLFVSALLTSSSLTGTAASSTTICAAPDGDPEATGSCWDDPLDLHGAFARAKPGDEVWIQQGTYSPGADEHSSFYLPDGVHVLGGYTGSHADPSERDPNPANTVLDGEDRNFTVVVAAGIQDATLNGVTIQGGAATLIANEAIDLQRRGGGVFVSNAAVTFQNLVIANNRGRFGGGGVYVDEGSNTIFRDVTFQGNSTTHPQSGRGGGMRIRSGEAILTNVTFRFNEAVRGGGLFVDGGSISIDNSLFAENRASQGGGGISVYSGELHVEDSRFVVNEAVEEGGGLYVSRAGTSVTLDRVDLTGNVAGNGGGGAWIQSSELVIERSAVTGNQAGGGPGGGLALAETDAYIVNTRLQGNQARLGGGLSLHNADATIINVLMTGNAAVTPEQEALASGPAGDEAERESMISDPWRHVITGEMFPSDYLQGDLNHPGENAGGALLITGIGSIDIINGTIAGNRGGPLGAAVYRVGDNTVRMLNSIIYHNLAQPDEVDDEHGAQVFSDLEPEATTRMHLDHVLLQGGCPLLHGVVCLETHDDDPRFLDLPHPDNAPTESGDYRLWFTSPAIDAADPSHLPTGVERDVLGSQRRVEMLTESPYAAGSVLDIGAIETTNTIALPDAELFIDHQDDTLRAQVAVRSDVAGKLSGTVEVDADDWGFQDVVLGRLTAPQASPGITRSIRLDGEAVLDDGRLVGFMVEAEFSNYRQTITSFRMRLDTGDSTNWRQVTDG